MSLKLLSVSAATIDRLLKAERKKYLLGWKGHTKSGTLLKESDTDKNICRLERE